MASSNPDSRLIIVGGAPRSGTTLLQNMLDCHPGILGGPEFLHLKDIVDLRRKLRISVSKEWIDLICSNEDVDREIYALIIDLLLPFADRHEARMLSEKSPMNILVFPELIELLPNAKFIHVIRDPRAVISSLLKVGDNARRIGQKPAGHAKDIPSAAAYVKSCLKSGIRAAREHPDRVLTVVYENLVKSPEFETRRICQFLDVPWDSAMCRPGDKEHLGEKAITTNSLEIWYNKKDYYRNPDPANLGKWRDELSALQKAQIGNLLGNIEGLSELGYRIDRSSMDFLFTLARKLRGAGRLRAAPQQG